MGDSLITVVTILLAAILMFIFPMMAMAERTDDVSEITVQTEVAEFVNSARTTGKITASDYDKLVADLYATGNTYDISMEIQVKDENPGKNNALGIDREKIGEDIYYSIYTSQILDEIDTNKDKAKYMKEGDILTVKASNTNNTISQMLKNFFYSLSGNDTYSIVGSASGIVTANGK